MRVSMKMIQNMVDTYNKYHTTEINGRYHKLVVDTDNVNGLGIAWMDIASHTITAHVSPSTAMSKWETYLVLKTLADHCIYVEQSKLTITRV